MSMNRSSFLPAWLLLAFLFLLTKTNVIAQAQENFIWNGYPVYSEKLPDGNILHISDSSKHLISIISDSDGNLIARAGNLGEYNGELPQITKTPEGTYLGNFDNEVVKFTIQGSRVSSFPMNNIPNTFLSHPSCGIGNTLTGSYFTVVKSSNVNPESKLIYFDILGNTMFLKLLSSDLNNSELKDAKISNDAKSGFIIELIFSNGAEEEYKIYHVDGFGDISYSNSFLTTSEYSISFGNLYAFENQSLSILNFSEKSYPLKTHFGVFNFDNSGNQIFSKSFLPKAFESYKNLSFHAAQKTDNEELILLYESLKNSATPLSELGIYASFLTKTGDLIETKFLRDGKILNPDFPSQEPSMYINNQGCFTVFYSKKNKFVSIKDIPEFCDFTPLIRDSIDLNLEINSEKINPGIWQNVTVSVKIKNEGNKASNFVEIDLPIPVEFAFSGATMQSGSYDNISGIWSIPKIAPGEIIELELSLFTLSLNEVSIFGQVANTDLPDVDSAPGNNSTNIPSEDDESVIIFNSSNGLPDLYIDNISNKIQFEIDSQLTFQIDIGNRGSKSVSEKFETEIYLSTNTTPDANDLLIGSFSHIGITAATVSNQSVNVFLPAGTLPGEYFLLLNTDAENAIPESNEGNNRFFKRIEVVDGISNDQNEIDLETKISSAENTFRIYEPINFTIEVYNNSSTAAENIIVAFPFPDEFAFTEYFTSSGVFNSWLKHWDIGRIEPFSEAVLTVSLFPLDNSSPQTLYTQITQAFPDDTDSTPGNAVCCSPNEDDEASITILPDPILNFRTKGNKQDLFKKSLSILNLYPNPAIEFLNVKAFSNIEKVEFTISNSIGNFVKKGVVSGEGLVDWRFNISELPPGIYNILFHTHSNVEKVNFIKLTP